MGIHLSTSKTAESEGAEITAVFRLDGFIELTAWQDSRNKAVHYRLADSAHVRFCIAYERGA